MRLATNDRLGEKLSIGGGGNTNGIDTNDAEREAARTPMAESGGSPLLGNIKGIREDGEHGGGSGDFA